MAKNEQQHEQAEATNGNGTKERQAWRKQVSPGVWDMGRSYFEKGATLPDGSVQEYETKEDGTRERANTLHRAVRVKLPTDQELLERLALNQASILIGSVIADNLDGFFNATEEAPFEVDLNTAEWTRKIKPETGGGRKQDNTPEGKLVRLAKRWGVETVDTKPLTAEILRDNPEYVARVNRQIARNKERCANDA